MADPKKAGESRPLRMSSASKASPADLLGGVRRDGQPPPILVEEVDDALEVAPLADGPVDGAGADA
jgi:hypothetical protein